MAQRVHPASLRLGLNRHFDLCSFQDISYSNLINKDLTLRKHIQSMFSHITRFKRRRKFRSFLSTVQAQKRKQSNLFPIRRSNTSEYYPGKMLTTSSFRKHSMFIFFSQFLKIRKSLNEYKKASLRKKKAPTKAFLSAKSSLGFHAFRRAQRNGSHVFLKRQSPLLWQFKQIQKQEGSEMLFQKLQHERKKIQTSLQWKNGVLDNASYQSSYPQLLSQSFRQSLQQKSQFANLLEKNALFSPEKRTHQDLFPKSRYLILCFLFLCLKKKTFSVQTFSSLLETLKHQKQNNVSLKVHTQSEVLHNSSQYQDQLKFYPIRLTKLVNAAFLTRFIVLFLEKTRESFRKVMKYGIKEASKDLRVKGIRIVCSGRLGGVEMAKTEVQKWGKSSNNTFSNKVDYDASHAKTKYGVIGVKVWITYHNS